MADRRDRLGQPEEENTAVESSQTASGLGGGAPEGGPAQPHERARRVVGREEDDARTPEGARTTRNDD
jgi:hypothetical protein